jgi:hypothetical protein
MILDRTMATPMSAKTIALLEQQVVEEPRWFSKNLIQPAGQGEYESENGG